MRWNSVFKQLLNAGRCDARQTWSEDDGPSAWPRTRWRYESQTTSECGLSDQISVQLYLELSTRAATDYFLS